MRRFLLSLFTTAVLLTAFTSPGWAAIGGWDINGRPTSDWFSANQSFRNIPLHWMRAADPLIGSISGGATGTGTNRYVDSGVTTTGGDGLSFEQAYTTVDAAINACTPSAGDWIHVAEGHAESGTAADLWDADVIGITIEHHGNGALQGTYTFADTDTTIAIGAANVTILGGRYLAGISDVVVGIDVENGSDDCSLIGLEFPEPTTSSWEFVRAIINTTADRLAVINCVYRNADATGATNFLDLDGGVINGLFIYGNDIYGEFSEGAVHSDDADLEVMVSYNRITNLTTGQHGIEFTAAALGTYSDNIVSVDTIAASIDPGSLRDGGHNFVSTAINAPLIVFPVRPFEGQENGPGIVIYVDSGTAGAGDGRSWGTAVATLDAGINLTTASRGDRIMVAPGHVETISAGDGFDADVIGISIIGLGNGSLAPTFTFDNANAEVSIGADNVTIKNLVFLCTVTGVLIGLDIEANADYATVDGCLFAEVGDATGTDEFISAVRIGNACIGTTIENCVFRAEAAGAISAIHSDNDTSFTTIQDNVIVGDYSSACVNFITVASTDLHILRNILINGDLVGDDGINAIAAINIVDSSGGFVSDNRIVSDVTTALLMRVGDDMVFMNNYVSDTDGDEFSGTTEDTAASIAAHVDG